MLKTVAGVKSAHLEAGACRPLEELRRHLRNSEPITYTANGNRARSAEEMLEKVMPLLPRIGVTRVAEVSQLADIPYPVFQTTRPNLHTHTRTGQNTGSQGKGPTESQALVSAIMEALEGYCAEPRNIRLIRGSYSYLRHQQILIPPTAFFHTPFATRAGHSEALMWTPAFCADQDCEVLIPAETAFFPFLLGDYSTHHHFPRTTNGLASGATYLEAVIHGIYEVIERYYVAAREVRRDEVIVEGLFRREFETFHDIERLAKEKRMDLMLYSVRFRKGPNIPFVAAYYQKDGKTYGGFGCAPTVEIAASRALSEAAQSLATIKSGSREDLVEHHSDFMQELQMRMLFFGATFPFHATLKKRAFAQVSQEKHHRNLRDEYSYLLKWLRARGFHNTCFVNLTRVGIEIPVVMVVVPSMPCWFPHFKKTIPSTAGVQSHAFRTGGE